MQHLYKTITLHNVMQYKAIRYYTILIIQDYTTLYDTIQRYTRLYFIYLALPTRARSPQQHMPKPNSRTLGAPDKNDHKKFDSTFLGN